MFRRRNRLSPRYEALAVYNSERARGIVHTKGYDYMMAELQKQWDRDYRPGAELVDWDARYWAQIRNNEESA